MKPLFLSSKQELEELIQKKRQEIRESQPSASMGDYLSMGSIDNDQKVIECIKREIKRSREEDALSIFADSQEADECIAKLAFTAGYPHANIHLIPLVPIHQSRNPNSRIVDQDGNVHTVDYSIIPIRVLPNGHFDAMDYKRFQGEGRKTFVITRSTPPEIMHACSITAYEEKIPLLLLSHDNSLIIMSNYI